MRQFVVNNTCPIIKIKVHTPFILSIIIYLIQGSLWMDLQLLCPALLPKCQVWFELLVKLIAVRNSHKEKQHFKKLHRLPALSFIAGIYKSVSVDFDALFG